MIRIWLQEPNQVGRWVAPRVNRPWMEDHMFAIGVGHHEKGPSSPNGAVMFESNTGEGGSISCHICGDGGRWLTRDFLWAVGWYAFERCRVKKILTMTASDNEAGLKINERLGHVYEYTIKDAFPGADGIIRTMTKDQCRWLNHKPEFLKEEAA